MGVIHLHQSDHVLWMKLSCQFEFKICKTDWVIVIFCQLHEPIKYKKTNKRKEVLFSCDFHWAFTSERYNKMTGCAMWKGNKIRSLHILPEMVWSTEQANVHAVSVRSISFSRLNALQRRQEQLSSCLSTEQIKPWYVFSSWWWLERRCRKPSHQSASSSCIWGHHQEGLRSSR